MLPLRKRVIPKAQLLGLCAMAWFVWVNRVDPKLAHESLGAVLAEALRWVSLAWIWSVLITVAIFATVVHDQRKKSSLVAASLPGVWFAPAIILMSTLSPAGLAVGLALVLIATWRLLIGWIPGGIAAEQPKAHSFEIDPAFLSWNSVPALVAAAAGQAGVLALVLHYPFWAATGFATSVAFLVGQAVVKGAFEPGSPPTMPPSGMGMVLTFLLALALTASSIQVGVMSGSGFGPEDQVSGRSTRSRVTALHDPPRSVRGSGGGFDGVILRPQPVEMHRTVLVVPAPWAKGAVNAAAPMSIPFSGEYWMYQAPWRHPPPWSVIEQGEPTEVSFRTTNGRPMEMAADQRLNGSVDLACCGRIQMVISRTGEDTAVLEVILIDSESGQWESLGTSEADRNALDFPIPTSGPLDKFNEIRVVYHRPASFSKKSARIAIERFVIVPR
jgi:hypothetical protein